MICEACQNVRHCLGRTTTIMRARGIQETKRRKVKEEKEQLIKPTISNDHTQ